jgi:hypothetical protein
VSPPLKVGDPHTWVIKNSCGPERTHDISWPAQFKRGRLG